MWNLAIEVAIKTIQDRILKLLQHFTPHTINVLQKHCSILGLNQLALRAELQ